MPNGIPTSEIHAAFCDAGRLRSKLDTLRNVRTTSEEDHRDLEHLHSLALEIMDTLDDMMFPKEAEGGRRMSAAAIGTDEWIAEQRERRDVIDEWLSLRLDYSAAVTLAGLREASPYGSPAAAMMEA